jgi:hypothetical protein
MSTLILTTFNMQLIPNNTLSLSINDNLLEFFFFFFWEGVVFGGSLGSLRHKKIIMVEPIHFSFQSESRTNNIF